MLLEMKGRPIRQVQPGFALWLCLGRFIYKQNNHSGKGCRCNPVYRTQGRSSNLFQKFPYNEPFFLKLNLVSSIAAENYQSKRDRSDSFLPPYIFY